MNQKESADALREERERLTEVLRPLPESAWETESLCDGWSVWDVVAHLVGNCSDAIAQRLEGVGSVEYNQRQVDERRGLSPSGLLEEWERDGAALESGIAALPDEVWEASLPHLPGTVGQGVLRLVEDLWVHSQDIRLALGQAPADGPGLAAALRVIVGDLPERVRRLAPEVGSVELTGGEFVSSIPIRDGGTPVRLQADAATLALLCTGRFGLEQALGDQRVRLTPEPAPAGLAEALNIYGG